MPNKKLSQKAISSGVWLGFSRLANRGLSLIRTVILARILAPQDFGLFGIALIILSALQNFSQPGTVEALIQSQKDKRIYLDVAWTIKVIRGITLALILIILAPMIARFFNEPKTTYLMYIISASLFLGGFGNQGVIYFIKDLKFHKQFIYELSCTIADFTVSIILVFIFKDAFSLAYGYLAGIIASCITSYIIHPYRPRFVINISIAKELSKFGRWVWSQSTLGFILNQGVGFFIGKFLGTLFLGLYQMALKITGLATSEIGNIFSNVGFSLYSKLQNSKLKLHNAYSKSLKINTFVVIPLALFIVVFAKQIINIVLGGKWSEVIPIIRIFALYGILTSISSINNAIFKAIGKPSITAKIQLIKLLCLSVGIFYVSTQWQLMGISLLIIFTELLMFPIELFIIIKKLGFSGFLVMQIIMIPTLTSLLAILTIKVFSNQIIIPHLNSTFLIISGLTSAAIYGSLLYWLDLKIHFGLRKIFKKSYFLELMGIKI